MPDLHPIGQIVLASRNRVRRSDEFTAAVRRGRRSARTHLVVHVRVEPGDSVPRAGFVVNKAVGGAVVRNTVTRRLRALVRDRLPQLPAGAIVVVRALPPSAAATSAQLGADLDACLSHLLPAGPPAATADVPAASLGRR